MTPIIRFSQVVRGLGAAFATDEPSHPTTPDEKPNIPTWAPPEWTDEDEAWLQRELDQLGWEQVVDLYHPDELIEDDDEPEEVKEDLSYQGRIKKKLAAIRTRTVRQAGRRMALKQASPASTLRKRAILAAKKMAYRYVTNGQNKARFTANAKSRAENRSRVLSHYTRSMVPRLEQRLRQIESSRVVKSRSPRPHK